jgi:hypothetical protein
VLIDEQNVQQSDAGDRADLLDNPPGRLDRPDIKNGDGKMKLIDNWREVATKAASMWMMYGATISGVIAIILPALDESGTPFAVLTVLLTIAGKISRLVAQPALHSQAEAAKTAIGRLEK